MLAVSISILILVLLYAWLMVYFLKQWRKIPEPVIQGSPQVEMISVIIAARNESENIGALLDALHLQHLSKERYEVIVVDDHSTDDTATIAGRYSGVKVIRLDTDHQNSYKKKAIEAGLAAAAGSLIITTDADCIPERDWLQVVATFQATNHADFVVAPVVFNYGNNFLEIFQSLDFLTLQGVTAVGVHSKLFGMCNGANMAYTLHTFRAVNGFDNIDQVASGDDMLLLQKFWKRDKNKVHYLKSPAAIVSTQPMKTWKQFINQRIRWASKARHYKNFTMNLVMILVYLVNISFPVLLVFGFWNPYYWVVLILILFIKTLAEFPFVNAVAIFYDKQKLMKYFLIFQPLHIMYTVVAGFVGQMGKYEWKGRRVK